MRYEPSVYKPTMLDRLSAAASQAVLKLPESLLSKLGSRTNADGDKLDPQVIASLKMLDIVHGEDFADLPVDKGRALIDAEAYLGDPKPQQVGDVFDTLVSHKGVEVRVRHYRPQGFEDLSAHQLPAVVYAHGGGWVLGSLMSHDPLCRFICAQAQVAVIAVDYRLAPEHAFPAGLDDVAAVLDAAMQGEIAGIDPAKVVVGGDSAGGNLSAAVCIRRKDEGLPQPRAQLLCVPVTNLKDFDTASYAEFADGLFLTRKHMEWYRNHYFASVKDRSHPWASPLLAEDLSDLAPAYVGVAGFDPLRDEGEAYARRLIDAGVETRLVRHRGMVHPWVNSTGVWDAARAAVTELCDYIRAAVAD